MKERIYTVPISEAFERAAGCPYCFLHQKLETDSLQYIMGAAMMEPDVRTETNEQGFCGRHLDGMLAMKNRLGLALILESLTARLCAEGAGALGTLRGSCYVCRRVDSFMAHFLENTLLMWKSEPDFAARLAARNDLCLPHAAALVHAAQSQLRRKECKDFTQVVTDPVVSRVSALHGHLESFCRSFDHRFAGQPLADDEKQAAEQTANFLAGGTTR